MIPQNYLPYGRHSIDADDIDAVIAALKSDYLTTGPRVAEFENTLAGATQARYAIACSNGTAALHLAARALNLGPGTTTIVPAITFVASANAVRLTGGDVVFADVDPDTGLMRPRDLEEAISRCPDGKADAVINIHLAGQTGDLKGIFTRARHANMRIIDDACHALGTSYADLDGEPKPIGCNQLADITCFSFHPVKTIAMGEGGALTTNDPQLAGILQRDRTHGIARDPDDFIQPAEAFESPGNANPWYYEMQTPGLNYRAPDLLCALGSSQIKKLDKFVSRRRELVALYDQMISGLSPYIQPLGKTPNVSAAWHLYVALIDFAALSATRSDVMQQLSKHGIGTQVHYLPVYRQPYYRELNPHLVLPGADAYYRKALTLPLFPAMSNEDPARVVLALQKVLGLLQN